MKAFKFLLFCLLFIGIKQWTEVATKGFCLQKIYASDLPFNPRWELAAAPLADTLSQPYTLIGAGSECFAFRSADGKTVIKFFKLDHTRPVYFLKGLLREDHRRYAGTLSNHWLQQKRLWEPFNSWKEKLFGIREFRLDRTFSSLKLAYEELQTETGILYLHLNPTETLNQSITLIDANGYRHTVDLDSTPFFIQQYAVPLEKHFENLLEQGDLAQAEQAIDSLYDLILLRCQKGFADRDFINRNIGYIENRAIEIDLGSFTPDPEMKSPLAYKKELFFATQELRTWLESHSRELHAYAEEQLKQRIYQPDTEHHSKVGDVSKSEAPALQSPCKLSIA